MTTTVKRAAALGRSIMFECDLPHRPAKVWRALTDPAVLSRWLMPNDIRPVVGHRFAFKGKPVEGWDGMVAAEVLAVEPERLIRYAWRGGPRTEYLDTVVTWTLTPVDGGTRLRLDHDGFPPRSFAMAAMDGEWRRLVTTCLQGHLAKLGD